MSFLTGAALIVFRPILEFIGVGIVVVGLLFLYLGIAHLTDKGRK